jgi:hypothetical protein
VLAGDGTIFRRHTPFDLKLDPAYSIQGRALSIINRQVLLFFEEYSPFDRLVYFWWGGL